MNPRRRIDLIDKTDGAARIRVLLIAPVGEGVGGIISQSNELVEALRDNAAVELRVIDSTQRYREDYDLRIGSRVIGGAWHAVRMGVRLVEGLLSFRPDVVHARSSASLGLVRDLGLVGLGRLAGARVFLQLHFGRIPELASRRNWEWRLLIATCRTTNGVCVLDARSREVLEGHVSSAAIHLVPNGVNYHWIEGIARSRGATRGDCRVPKVVFVGMVIPAKGVVELVEACSRINAVKFELELIGPVGKAMRQKLETIAGEREAGSWLHLAGEVPRAEAVGRMATAEVFVLPSYTEGFPLTVLEAMACGTAVVATDVGAIRDMLTDGDMGSVGVVVPPGDASALRVALEELLSNPERRHALGAAARKRCETHYQFSAVVRQLLKLWRS